MRQEFLQLLQLLTFAFLFLAATCSSSSLSTVLPQTLLISG